MPSLFSPQNPEHMRKFAILFQFVVVVSSMGVNWAKAKDILLLTVPLTKSASLTVVHTPVVIPVGNPLPKPLPSAVELSQGNYVWDLYTINLNNGTSKTVLHSAPLTHSDVLEGVYFRLNRFVFLDWLKTDHCLYYLYADRRKVFLGKIVIIGDELLKPSEQVLANPVVILNEQPAIYSSKNGDIIVKIKTPNGSGFKETPTGFVETDDFDADDLRKAYAEEEIRHKALQQKAE